MVPKRQTNGSTLTTLDCFMTATAMVGDCMYLVAGLEFTRSIPQSCVGQHAKTFQSRTGYTPIFPSLLGPYTA